LKFAGSRWLRLAGSVALLGFLAWRTDWRQIAAAFAGLRVGLWLLAVGLYVLTQLVSSLRWRLLARPLGFSQPLGQFIAFYYVGMFFNLVLPTSVGGDVVRAWYLDGRSGRRGAAFLSVFADRVSGLLMLIAIACGAVAGSPLDLPWHVSWTVYGIGTAAALGLAMLFLLARPNAKYKMQSAKGKMEAKSSTARQPWRQRLLNLPFALCILYFALFPSRRIFFVTTFLSVVVQSGNVVLVWLVGRALGVTVPLSYYAILVPVVTLLTMVPISLNGMGVREWGTVLLLGSVGVDAAMALTLAFLWFATYSVVSLAGAGYYLLGRFPRFEVRSDDEAVRGDPDQGREGQPRAAA
jgi:uncharacterized protein (TIRG00374 family)